jgi:prolyl-tRNA editing enzyme YbaK/EbsC (Cys-tRNA(Pro) deacylase)
VTRAVAEKVKSRLEATEAYLADPEDLLALDLSPGTVCAILEPVWSMPHLVSHRLLNRGMVMTNNGTRTGYFEFDPALLTEAADVVVDDFEK